jgi:hypothetical protein
LSIAFLKKIEIFIFYLLISRRLPMMMFLQLFINEKEVPALIEAIERFIAIKPQCSEAQELLNRIFTCIEKQCHSKANT